MKILIVICLLVVLIGFYLYLICPNINRKRKNAMQAFEKVYIAHRGFFDNKNGIPENSLPAFQKAVDAGLGIELDVQLSKDGYLLVFHDEDLKRMCGVDKKIRELNYAEIQQYTLHDTQERIPLFGEVLKIINGKIPLIVEVKYEGDVIAATKAMAEMMDNYSGIWCMESFHPRAVQWFKKNRPQIIRGQLSTEYKKDGLELTGLTSFMLSNLMYNNLGRPDFIAYNHKYYNNLSLSICRLLFSPEIVAWTIKNPTEMEMAKKHHFDVIIFDNFNP